MCILSPRQRCLESDFEWLRSESYDYNAGKEGKLHVEDRLSSQNSKRELNTTTCVRSYQETSISSLPGFLRIMFDDILFNEAWVRGLVRHCWHTPWQGMILSNFQLETVLAFRFIVLVIWNIRISLLKPHAERENHTLYPSPVPKGTFGNLRCTGWTLWEKMGAWEISWTWNTRDVV